MSKRFVKTDRITVRLSPADLADLVRAARLESNRRRESVDESTLLRELAMPRVRELLAQPQAADVA